MQTFRKFLDSLTAIAKNRSGEVASEDAILVPLAMLGGLVVLAGADVMPSQVVEFAVESFGGALDLLS